VAVGLPIALTDDPDGARAEIDRRMSWYGTLPAFQAMFDREGVAGPGAVAILGDERVLDRELDRIEEAGATDFVAQVQVVDPDAAARTFDYLVARAGRG
jgi:hypothetical protein